MDSIDYYNSNAAKFFETTAFVNMDVLYSKFEKCLPAKAKILDAGCGSGRDTKYFLSKGYSVDAFDASSEIVKIANEHTGIEVRYMTFDDLAETEVYDGIWCCASLLHVPKADISPIFDKFWTALKPNGVCYVSFKQGESVREVSGRLFNDYTPELLQQEVELNTQFSIKDLWLTDDLRPDRHGQWVNALLQRNRNH